MDTKHDERNCRGVACVESAIVPIVFAIVAAALSFVVHSTGASTTPVFLKKGQAGLANVSDKAGG